MQTAWNWMRRRVTRSLIQIQALWHSDNTLTNFEQHWSTLKIEADKKFSGRKYMWQAMAKCKPHPLIIYFCTHVSSWAILYMQNHDNNIIAWRCHLFPWLCCPDIISLTTAKTPTRRVNKQFSCFQTGGCLIIAHKKCTSNIMTHWAGIALG